jgi:hypothetical protein
MYNIMDIYILFNWSKATKQLDIDINNNHIIWVWTKGILGL